jgi:hypothetical protein
MSTSISEIVEYRCVDDCVQSGCPGHKMQLLIHNTVNIVHVEIDGKRFASFDENQIEALKKLLG